MCAWRLETKVLTDFHTFFRVIDRASESQKTELFKSALKFGRTEWVKIAIEDCLLPVDEKGDGAFRLLLLFVNHSNFSPVEDVYLTLREFVKGVGKIFWPKKGFLGIEAIPALPGKHSCCRGKYLAAGYTKDALKIARRSLSQCHKGTYYRIMCEDWSNSREHLSTKGFREGTLEFQGSSTCSTNLFKFVCTWGDSNSRGLTPPHPHVPYV